MTARWTKSAMKSTKKPRSTGSAHKVRPVGKGGSRPRADAAKRAAGEPVRATDPPRGKSPTTPTARRVALPRGALAKLRATDAALRALMDRVGPFRLEVGRADNHLAALVRAVIYQQLSGRAAATIHGRFRALFAADRYPEAHEIAAVPDEKMRAAGLSRQKVGYLRDLAAHVASGELRLSELEHLPDDEILREVTKVKGFGRWSAEMFLLFHLGRLDVWPIGDLAIRKALTLLQARKQEPKKDELEALGEPYRPYRSVVSWYLWRSLDTTTP